MASKTLRRVLKSGFKAGTGVLGAQIQAARDEEERRAQRNKDIMAELLGYSRIDQSKAATEASQARTEATLNPGIDTKDIITSAAQRAMENGDWATYNLLTGKGGGSGNWKPLGKTPYLYNEKSGETKRLDPAAATAIDVANTKQPKTGIGDFKDVVTGRQDENYWARDDAGVLIMRTFPDLFLDINNKGEATPKPQFAKFTPEQLAEYAKQNVPETPETIEKSRKTNMPWTWFNSPETVPNPDYKDVGRILSNINIPEEYRLSADASMGLQDSVTRAQDDPAYAAALLDAGGGAAPSMEQFAEFLKGEKAKGAPIYWDIIAKDFPEMDIEALRQLVGE